MWTKVYEVKKKTMITAYIAYCSVPSLIGFYFGIVAIKYLLKSKLIRLLKLITFVISWFWSTVITLNFFYDLEETVVIVSFITSFITTFVVGSIFRKKSDEV